MLNYRLILISLLLISNSLNAEPASPGSIYELTLAELLDVHIVSIATGTKKSTHKAPAITSVITSEDIKRMGATHLAEVLETIPGLHVMPSDLSRLDNMFAIRGIQGGFNPHILVMLDGIEIKKNATGGLPSTFRYPVSNIARIEVIRGPGSAIYGADAFSGVINIISKRIDKTGFSLGGRSGSFDSNDTWVQASYGGEDISFRLALDSMKSDGDKNRIANDDLQTIMDGVFGTTVSEAPTHLSSNYDVLNLQADVTYGNLSFKNWWWQQNKGGVGAGAAQAIDTHGYQDYDLYRGALNYSDTISDEVNWSVSGYYQRAREYSFFHIFPANSLLPIGADGNVEFSPQANAVLFSHGMIGTPTYDQSDYGVNGTIQGSQSSEHNWRVNLGYVKKDLDTSESKNFGPGIIDGSVPVVDGQLTNVSETEYVFIQDTYRHNHFIAIQDQWKISSTIEMVMGLRYDDFSDFGSTFNPRLSLVWETTDKLSSKFLYGHAFRAPAFDELENTNNPALVGNPNLKPEQIKTFEMAFDYRASSNTSLIASFYQYEAKDLIVLLGREDNTSVKEKHNAQGQKSYGFELEGVWKISESLKLKSNFARQISTSLPDEQQSFTTPSVPRDTLSFLLDQQISTDFSAHIQLFYVGDRIRPALDNRVKIKDYWLFNANVNYQPEHWPIDVTLSIKNLFNKAVYEPSDGSITNDFRMPTRQVWLQLGYAF